MENNVKIIQIERSQWKGREGDIMEDFIGLGDDSMLYRWHKGTGKWVLWVITK